MATNPEILLISAMLKEQDHMTAIANGINSSLFHDFTDEWKWMEKYIAQHRRTPSKKAFRAKFPNTTLYNVDDVDHFVSEVKESHVRYQLIEAASEIASGIKQEDDPSSILKKLHGEIISIESQVSGESENYEVTSSWDETYVMVRERAGRVADLGQAGIPTGYQTLDLATGGVHPGHYWVIAGRLGQGKTWTMVRIAVEAMMEGKKVQYFSLESSRHQVAMRVHTILSSMINDETFRNLDLVKGENFNVVQYKKFLKKLKGEMDGRFFINDQTRGQVSPLTIAATIERHQPDIVFVDYLTLLETPGKDDDWIGVAKISASLQQTAQRYNVPILVASQINRSGGSGNINTPPGSEHLSRSDAIGQDADAVVTMKQVTTHTARMRLAKYRHGRDGQVWWCSFKPNTGELEEITGDEAADIRDMDLEESDD